MALLVPFQEPSALEPPADQYIRNVESQKKIIAAAIASGDEKSIQNAYLDLFRIFPDVITSHLSEYDHGRAESVLDEWEEALTQAKPYLNERQQFYSHARHQNISGYFYESRGLEAYYVDGNFISAPRLLEKGEAYLERGADLLEKVVFPEDAPAEAVEMQNNTVALLRADVLKVKGLRRLIQGELESETFNMDLALKLLEESIKILEEGENKMPAEVPGRDAVTAIMEKGLHSLNFKEYARALIHKTRSEQSLIEGDLIASANEQKKRAEALERAQSMHVRADTPLHENFAGRLSRDIHIANQRHKNLMDEAEKRPKGEGKKALVFFVMAIGSAVLFIWLSVRFELLRKKAVFVILLLFVMAVAGIGAQLVNWKDAANWLGGSITEPLKK